MIFKSVARYLSDVGVSVVTLLTTLSLVVPNLDRCIGIVVALCVNE